MATWSENGRVVAFATCVCVFALACTLSPLSGDSPATAAGVPPSMAQGFSEIVKKVTPAVVNIAVTGGSEGGRGRRPLPHPDRQRLLQQLHDSRPAARNREKLPFVSWR